MSFAPPPPPLGKPSTRIPAATSGTWKCYQFTTADLKRAVHPQELKALADVQQTRHYHTFKPLPGLEHTPLCLHAAYQLREILTAVGRWTEDSRPEFREGVLRLHDQKTELIFITLDKSEARREGVAYHDYAISRERFHWQTQNSAGPSTEAG